MTRQNKPPQGRNCPGATLTRKNLLRPFLASLTQRTGHPMADIITIIFLAAFFFTLGYYIGRGR